MNSSQVSTAAETRVDSQIQAAATEFPDVTCRPLPDGTSVVSATMMLPAGWNRDRVTVRFLLPIAFPAAQPDCFLVDPDLRLVGGGVPTNTGVQPLGGAELLWFSWHISTWFPSTDTITTYLRFIARRLHDVR